MQNPLTHKHNSTIQMFIPLGFYLDFERMVDKYDISRTVLELTERINVFDCVEPATGGPHDLYDDLMMLWYYVKF